MKFLGVDPSNSLSEWRNSADPKEKACAHNIDFEERVSIQRSTDLETFIERCDDISTLKKELVRYYRSTTFFRAVPICFSLLNGGAFLPLLSPEQKMIRVENVSQILAKTGTSFDTLKTACERRDRPSLEFLQWFCDEWNDRSDILKNPVSFSAFKDENLAEVAANDWFTRLRDKLGLAHYDGTFGEIPVMLMEYTAGEIISQVKAAKGFACTFATPTTLDGAPYFQFFPTPSELAYGAPMPLQPVLSENDLVAEVLHPRLTYVPAHMARVGIIQTPIPAASLRDLRNNQLLALRLEALRDDFGEEM